MPHMDTMDTNNLPDVDLAEAGPLRNLLATDRAKSAIASTADFLKSDRAKSATTFLAGIYGRAAGVLPASAQDRLSAVEDSIAKRITTENVDSFIGSLDGALARLNDRAATVVTQTSELPGSLKSRAQEGAARAVVNIDTTVATQITRLEGLLDALLPEDVDSNNVADVDADAAVAADADEKQNKVRTPWMVYAALGGGGAGVEGGGRVGNLQWFTPSTVVALVAADPPLRGSGRLFCQRGVRSSAEVFQPLSLQFPHHRPAPPWKLNSA